MNVLEIIAKMWIQQRNVLIIAKKKTYMNIIMSVMQHVPMVILKKMK